MPFVRELTSKVSSLKGIGPAAARDLAALGVGTVADLITLYPRAYDDRTQMGSVDSVPDGGSASVNTCVLIESHTRYPAKGRMVLKLTAIDLNSEKRRRLHLHCFGRDFLERACPDGSSFYINALVVRQGGSFMSSSFTIGNDEKSVGIGEILPVYPISGKLTQALLRKTIKAALSPKMLRFDDEVPVKIKRRRGLMDMDRAIRAIHFPSSMEEREEAWRTLAYTELFHMQLALLLGHESPKGPGLGPSELEEKLIKNLPFSLTEDQEKCLSEIRRDLSGPGMDRLLQGDVGSGKTLVAWLSALYVISNGGQVAFMAPTELLARQHAELADKLLSPLGVRVAFLTSDVKSKRRGYLLDALKRGEVDILIGTHALFSKDVEYRNLRYAIIDEQHRFGVEQRQALEGKGKRPHVLMMSATPIPRTLAMTVYGSMETSTIRTMPKGRLPIKTHLAGTPEKIEKMYQSIGVEFMRGHQAYFVCPRIDDSGDSPLKDVTTMFEELKGRYPGVPSALVHSKIPEEEKTEILRRFRDKEIMYLVATSVVEVGIDVPDATCMVIEHAERFGLAALHQLRGRVGRGALQSWCFLVWRGNLTPEAKERLLVMLNTTDGFEIAEKDLAIRGPGEIMGRAQSGYGADGLKAANVTRDIDLMADARDDARLILEEDKALMGPGNSFLRGLVAQEAGKPENLR